MFGSKSAKESRYYTTHHSPIFSYIHSALLHLTTTPTFPPSTPLRSLPEVLRHGRRSGGLSLRPCGRAQDARGRRRDASAVMDEKKGGRALGSVGDEL